MRLVIYRPIITDRLTQRFGDNKACVYPNGKIVAKRSLVCPSGSQDFYRSIGMHGHNGLDLAAWHGESVFHAGMYDGWMKIEKDAAGGIGVDVISNDPVTLDDGSTSYVKLRYWHLKTPIGHDGKQVKFGEVIGLADNTGSSSGDHLHFGLKKCDKDGNSTEKFNGYNGAIDPNPYYHHSPHAKQAAEDLRIPPPPLSPQEVKEMTANLSAARRLLLLLKEKLSQL